MLTVCPAGRDEGNEREELGAGGEAEGEKFPEEPQHLPDVDWTEAPGQVTGGHRLEPGRDAHRSSVLWDERGRQVLSSLLSLLTDLLMSPPQVVRPELSDIWQSAHWCPQRY